MFELVSSGAKAPVVKGNVKKISAGTADIAALTTSGNLYVIGTSYYSGTGSTVTKWTKVADNVEDFCSGYRQVLVRKKDGTFLFCGTNQHFPLNSGSNFTSYTDVTSYLSGPLTGKTIKKMEISQLSLAILCTDGTVIMSGRNAAGGLGTGNTTAQYTPTLRSDITNIKDIKFDFSSTDTTYYLTNDGLLFGAGDTTYGNLGTRTTPQTRFIQIDSSVGSSIVTQITPAINGLLYTKRILSTGEGRIMILGRHFSGSLGTGVTADTIYSTPTSVLTIPFNKPDPTVVAGTYHARYWYDNYSPFFTGSAATYIGVNATFNNTTRYAFLAQPTSTFPWDQYDQTKGAYTASYVVSEGKIYGSGGNTNGLLYGTSSIGSNVNSYTLLDITDLV